MREEIETILDRWTDINEILLRTGEMTAQERRTVLAVTNAMAREIRRALEISHLNEIDFMLDDLSSDPPSDMRMARELVEQRRIDRKEDIDD